VGEGTPCYVGICQDGVNGTYVRFNGNQVAAGWGMDGVFANAVANNAASPAAGGTSNFTGIVLPTVWTLRRRSSTTGRRRCAPRCSGR
jgi:hypothetical protein